MEYYYDYYYNVNYCSNNKIPVSFVRMGKDQTGKIEGIGYYSVLNNSDILNYDLDDYLDQKDNSLEETPGESTQCIS